MANPLERLAGLEPAPSIKPAYCGPASTDCILRYYFGSPADQDFLARIMDFTESWGTPLENLHRGPNYYGLFAIALEGSTFEIIDYLLQDNGVANLNYMDRDPDQTIENFNEYGHYAIYCGRSGQSAFEQIHLMCDYRQPNRYQEERYAFERYWFDIDLKNGVESIIRRWSLLVFNLEDEFNFAAAALRHLHKDFPDTPTYKLYPPQLAGPKYR